jgi:hypothetical protein
MARLYVRIFKVNKHGLDDWLMLAAMVSHLQPRLRTRRSIPMLTCGILDFRHWSHCLCDSRSSAVWLEHPRLGSYKVAG